MIPKQLNIFVTLFLLIAISPALFAQTTPRYPKQQYGQQKANLKTAEPEKIESISDVERNFEEELAENIGSWSLEKCINYALENNLELTESELNARMSALTLSQSRTSRIPSFNGDASVGNSYGRSVDPTSNQFVNAGFLFNNMSLNSQVLLFGWFQKKNEIAQNTYNLQAAQEVYAQLRDNIALNVANGYLRILLAQEQVNVSKELLNTDLAQLEQTKQFVRAGKLPQLNFEQMAAQVASDSATLINVETEVQLALLQMRALLNLDYKSPFEIAAPDLRANELLVNNDLPSADEVYELAQHSQHRLKAQQLNMLAAQKGIEQAKATKYPSLFLGGNLSTSYSSQFKEVTGQTVIGDRVLGNVNVAGNLYPITTPEYDYSTRRVPYTQQLDKNLRSNIALTLSVPIFNGYQVKTNIERAKIGWFTQQVAMQREQQNLQQDIRSASLQARAAQQKYKAALSTQGSAKRALDFAIKRYNIGMLPTFEYTQTQNNYNQASYNALAAKYEMIFKMKVLDFYIGKPIKL